MGNSSEYTKQLLKGLKMEVAEDLGRLNYVRENNDHYKGDVQARINGAQGGPIGGEMVRRMIAFAESNMVDNNNMG